MGRIYFSYNSILFLPTYSNLIVIMFQDTLYDNYSSTYVVFVTLKVWSYNEIIADVTRA